MSLYRKRVKRVDRNTACDSLYTLAKYMEVVTNQGSNADRTVTYHLSGYVLSKQAFTLPVISQISFHHAAQM